MQAIAARTVRFPPASKVPQPDIESSVSSFCNPRLDAIEQHRGLFPVHGDVINEAILAFDVMANHQRKDLLVRFASVMGNYFSREFLSTRGDSLTPTNLNSALQNQEAMVMSAVLVTLLNGAHSASLRRCAVDMVRNMSESRRLYFIVRTYSQQPLVGRAIALDLLNECFLSREMKSRTTVPVSAVLAHDQLALRRVCEEILRQSPKSWLKLISEEYVAWQVARSVDSLYVHSHHKLYPESLLGVVSGVAYCKRLRKLEQYVVSLAFSLLQNLQPYPPKDSLTDY